MRYMIFLSVRAEGIVSFEDITWDMRREVGGKNAGLSDLKNSLKMNIPNGFVITTYAFDEFIGEQHTERKNSLPE